MKSTSRDGLLEFAACEILKRVQEIHDWLSFAADWLRRQDIVLIGQISSDEHFELKVGTH